ncbi:hypothetical protein HVIM_04282 [Roseomonas mucosa]|nr:hypothetical protein HVIM_04282 [Roseomonas mucosa]QDE00765.1 hypothetical protein ADP8_04282 [Roseomonas mucosa]
MGWLSDGTPWSTALVTNLLMLGATARRGKPVRLCDLAAGESKRLTWSSCYPRIPENSVFLGSFKTKRRQEPGLEYATDFLSPEEGTVPFFPPNKDPFRKHDGPSYC